MRKQLEDHGGLDIAVIGERRRYLVIGNRRIGSHWHADQDRDNRGLQRVLLGGVVA